jgi:4-hydroxy-2-oxoheptanedioate aldolase
MIRINKAIELLEDGQPVYYETTRNFTYENGVELSQTWADIIRLDLEHGAFDMTAVNSFMQGLLDGGPTPSGHLTPTVLAELPIDGISEDIMLANSWMVKQVLAQGVHGILLCHAETPGAVRVMNEFSRYSFTEPMNGLNVGRRGHGGQQFASKVWGVTELEYMAKADLWPLAPHGELLMGVKIENLRALANVEETLKVPGLAYAEWGPGDMGMSMGYPDRHDPPYPIEMLLAEKRVENACRKNQLYFLNQVNEVEPEKLTIDRDMIGKAKDSDTANKIRQLTLRKMKWK